MKTTEQTIKDFNIIHSHKYDYSLVQYKGSKTKVKIICREHGVFEQSPNHHLRGRNCPKCSKKYKKTNDDCIKLFNDVHNFIYDYSLVNFVNNNTKVKIICPKHGIFEQLPPNHIFLKQGCPKCLKNSPSNEEFIIKCNLIHNNLYDYSLVNYKNAHTKIKIVCGEHGVFEQYPYAHLYKKQGCPHCSNTSKGEENIKIILDKYNMIYYQQYKFNGCKNIHRLKFDFYLPEHNICIEYDGLQHFKPVEFFGGETRFKYQQKIDRIKTDFCKNNDINLVRIKYSENIEEKLNFLYNNIL